MAKKFLQAHGLDCDSYELALLTLSNRTTKKNTQDMHDLKHKIDSIINQSPKYPPPHIPKDGFRHLVPPGIGVTTASNPYP